MAHSPNVRNGSAPAADRNGWKADTWSRGSRYAKVCSMDTILAFAVGGVLLFIVGRSTYKVWKIGSAEMSAADRRLAPVTVVAVLVLFIVGVLAFHFVHP